MLEDARGHRSGRVGAETTALEGHRDHDLRVLRRRQHDVPGLVGLVGALLIGGRIAAWMFCCAVVALVGGMYWLETLWERRRE